LVKKFNDKKGAKNILKSIKDSFFNIKFYHVLNVLMISDLENAYVLIFLYNIVKAFADHLIFWKLYG